MGPKKEYLKIVGTIVIVWVNSVSGPVTVLSDLSVHLVSVMSTVTETYNAYIIQLMVLNQHVNLLLLLMDTVIKILGSNANLVQYVFKLLASSIQDVSINTVCQDKALSNSLELILLPSIIQIMLKCVLLDMFYYIITLFI